MTLSKNDYFKKEDIRGNCKFIHILGVLDDLIFPSMEFRSYDEKEINGTLLNRECPDGSVYHCAELEAEGWTKCTAQEAGAPKESWSPKKGEFYIWATFDGNEVLTNEDEFYGFEYELKRIALGNCFPLDQEAEAIAWLKSKLDLKV